ncbi:hypothetical protein BX600DRAFT_467412 [Xylariales sp. PMI_506]|nr:hypothetical protein BX600DRAFT_467412 [Xylariales sp. PMI_506]
MADTYAMALPEGYTHDFSPRTSVQITLISVYSVTFAFSTVFMLLRLYTKAFISRKLNFDDILIWLAWAVSLTFFIGMVKAMPFGFGRHLWDVLETELLGYYNLLLMLALTYIWPPALTKLAMLVLYHQLNPSTMFRICIYISMASTVVYTVVFTGLFCGPCNPLSYGTTVCLNNIAISQAVLNILTDVAIIILPLPMIHQLNMPLKQKTIVGLLLSLGSAVVLASVVRISYVKAMAENPDFTWTQASAAIWSSVELNIGIACNSLALLKPFIRKHMPWLLNNTQSGTKSTSRHLASENLGNSARLWRGDKAGHSYQLRSFEVNQDTGVTRKNKIFIENEYSVHVDGGNSKEGSTDDILVTASGYGR